jgi:NADH-quinone oxidoreductase subunit N
VIVIGSMISLGYYLPVVAAMWMRESPADAERAPSNAAPSALPALAGGSPELDVEDELRAGPQLEVLAVAAIAGAATLFFGIVPQPLFDLVHGVGSGLGLL